ncbi:regulatory protein RecX family protein isoform X2 [Carex rostrata]
MRSVSLNRSLQIYLQLQSRDLTVPWLRRGCRCSISTVRCTQSDYSIPQIKTSQTQNPVSLASFRKQKSEESCDDTVLEKLETVCNNASETRLNKTASLPKKRTKKQVHEESDVECSISVCRNASENRLLKDVNLDDSSSCQEEEISKRTLEDAENVAIQLLAGRAFSVAELRKKLSGKKFPVQVVDKVIADIKDRGLVNDGLYAESFSQSKWLSANWGPRRIKQALLQKGVPEAEVNKATRKVFEHDDDYSSHAANQNHNEENADLHESESSNAQLVMSESCMDRLFIQASKLWLRGQDLSTENRKTRVIRWLQYRGFTWGVVAVIVKRLQSQFTNSEDDSNISNKRNSYGGGSSSNKKVNEDISEESMDKLLVQVSKQWIKGQNTSIENRKARITRWLHYRGYNWEVIGVILKRLQSQ